MLKPIDQQRLDQLKADLELLNIRFPVAVLAERMNTNKGNLSAYLNGKKPISDQFLAKFYEVFKEDLAYVTENVEGGEEEIVEEDEEEPEPEPAAPPSSTLVTVEKASLENIQFQLYAITGMLHVIDLQQKSLNDGLVFSGVVLPRNKRENRREAGEG